MRAQANIELVLTPIATEAGTVTSREVVEIGP
jgi:hypothetical protein